MIFKNLTPNLITIRCDGADLVLYPEAEPARLEEIESASPALHRYDGDETPIGVRQIEYGDEITGLPQREQGTVIITSLLVAQRARALGRGDVYSPGELTRDDLGRPNGCIGLRAPVVRYWVACMIDGPPIGVAPTREAAKRHVIRAFEASYGRPDIVWYDREARVRGDDPEYRIYEVRG